MIAICSIGATLFFGGYREFWFLSNTILSVDRTPLLGPIYIFLKIFILLFGMIWVRATLPRIRYDRLMAFGWKVLLPLSLALVFVTAAVSCWRSRSIACSLGHPGGFLPGWAVAIVLVYRTFEEKRICACLSQSSNWTRPVDHAPDDV